MSSDATGGTGDPGNVTLLLPKTRLSGNEESPVFQSTAAFKSAGTEMSLPVTATRIIDICIAFYTSESTLSRSNLILTSHGSTERETEEERSEWKGEELALRLLLLDDWLLGRAVSL